jgi:hypothetical protein
LLHVLAVDHFSGTGWVATAWRRYAVDRAPFLWYCMADKDGNLVHDYPVPLQQGIM